MTEFFRDVPNLSYQQFSVFTKLFWEIKWESISQVKNFPAYFKSCKNFKGRLINVILFSPWYFLLLLRSMMKKELLFAWFKFKKPPFGTKGVFLQADSPAHFIFFKRIPEGIPATNNEKMKQWSLLLFGMPCVKDSFTYSKNSNKVRDVEGILKVYTENTWHRSQSILRIISRMRVISHFLIKIFKGFEKDGEYFFSG